MDPVKVITLATLLWKGIGALKNRSKSRVSNAPGSQAYTGVYPNATPRGSTERDAEDQNTPGGAPTPSPGAGGGTDSGGGSTDTMTDLQRRNALKWGSVGRLEGFQVGDLYGGETEGMKPRNSVKNTFGRIASRYEAKPSSIDKILADADFQRFFPNAKKVGFDKIDFGGVKSDFESGSPVGIVDVGNNFDPESDTGRGWWWGYDGGDSSSSSSSSTSSWNRPQWNPDPTGPDSGYSPSSSPAFAVPTPSVSAMTPEEIWEQASRTFGTNRRVTLGDMSRKTMY